MKSQSSNKFYSKDKFVSRAFWKALDSSFVLFPTCWIKRNCQPSLEVNTTKLTLAFGYWRYQIDFGLYQKIKFDGPIEWDDLGFTEFFQWSKRRFGRDWNRIDIEKLFSIEPRLKRIVIMGTAHNHYVRVLLARSMLSAQDNGRLGNNTKLGSALNEMATGPATVVKPPQETLPSSSSFSEDGDESVDLHGLDGLSKKINKGGNGT